MRLQSCSLTLKPTEPIGIHTSTSHYQTDRGCVSQLQNRTDSAQEIKPIHPSLHNWTMCYSLCAELLHANILNLHDATQGVELSGAERLLNSHQGEREQRIFSTSQEDIQYLQDFISSLMCTRKSCWQCVLQAHASLLCWYLEPRKLRAHDNMESASAGKAERLGVLLQALHPATTITCFYFSSKDGHQGAPVCAQQQQGQARTSRFHFSSRLCM